MNLDETIVYHMRQSKIEDDINNRIRHIQIAYWLTELKERRLKDGEEEEENNGYYHW